MLRSTSSALLKTLNTLDRLLCRVWLVRCCLTSCSLLSMLLVLLNLLKLLSSSSLPRASAPVMMSPPATTDLQAVQEHSGCGESRDCLGDNHPA